MNISNNTLKGILYSLIAAFCWGFLAILLKITVQVIPSESIVWTRFVTAFIIVLAVSAFKQPKNIKIIIKPPVITLISALFLGFNYLGFMYGIKYTTPNNSQVFIQLGPILLAISGFIYFKEKINYKQAIGFFIALTGFGFFYSQQLSMFSKTEAIYNKGVLWVIFGAVAWAAYSFTQKLSVKKYPVNQINLIVFGVPALFFIPFVQFSVFQNLTLKWWLILLSLGLNTYIAYTSISLALKYMDANKVSIIITNNPIITFISMELLAYFQVRWIEHEKMNFLSFIGAFLVISGSILVVIFRNKIIKKNIVVKS